MKRSSSRREFLRSVSGGAAALAVSATGHGRVLGANDRLSIGIIGCGDRGRNAHMTGVNEHANEQNLEITAVCDVWSVAREKAVSMTREWIYPEGFLVSYSTNFGNGGGNAFRLSGTKGALDMMEWDKPVASGDGAIEKGPLGDPMPVKPIERPDHFLDWLRSVRSRKAPHAPIDAGYQHAVAVILADRAYETGRRQTYDSEKREIRAD